MTFEERQEYKKKLKNTAKQVIEKSGLDKDKIIRTIVIDAGDYFYVEALRKNDATLTGADYKAIESAMKEFKKRTKMALYFPECPLPTSSI